MAPVLTQVVNPVLHPVMNPSGHMAVPAARSRLAMELRLAAEDLAGRVDRDELTFDEEIRLSEALDAALDAVMPVLIEALDEALTPRLEALPLHARLTLARARRRQEFGVD